MINRIFFEDTAAHTESSRMPLRINKTKEKGTKEKSHLHMTYKWQEESGG